MLNNLKNELNYTTTENGAVTHETSRSHLLDFFALAGAMRNRSEQDIMQLFSKAFAENPLYAMKALFYMRDIREGNGERRLFRVCTKWLATNAPQVLIKNLPHIAEYGRWDDLIALIDTSVSKEVLFIIRQQWNNDVFGCSVGKPVSLLAKWMPSENASSPTTKRLAKIIAKDLNYTMRNYRKTLSLLRNHLSILESKMSAKQWDEINYSTVPSQAMLKYRSAFYRNDEERYAAYLSALKSPVTRDVVKINTKTLYPYQLVEKVLFTNGTAEENDLYNVMWENLPDTVGDNYQNSIAVVDVSASMYGQPITVAVSLGLYIAEKNKGKFHNHFITFSSNPSLVEVVGTNFTEKVRNITKAQWCMNTDLKKTFDLILNTAIKYQLPQSEMPATLYIISDMQFDGACRGNKETLFQTMKKEFAQHGYELPRVVFWNVDARHNQVPVVKNEPNVQLVSGFSHNVFTSLMEQKEYSPFEYMIDVLSSERYEVITD